jgi:uncharacterized membrane protein
VTLAIPIQLESNWITIGWAAQGAILTWVGVRMRERQLLNAAALVLGLAVFRQVAFDTSWWYRALFTPVLNRYFLSGLAVSVFLLLAAYFWRQLRRGALVFVMAGLALFWLTTTVETYTYFDALLAAGKHDWFSPEAQQLRWTGQMALSLLWSVYAAALVAAGFRMGQSAFRWAGLGLFGLTLGKVLFVDMAELEQLYRIVAFLALGIILLAVAWAYQRAMRRGQEQQATLGDRQ